MDYVLCDQEMKPAMQIIVSKIVFIQGSVIFLACYGCNDKNGVQLPVQKLDYEGNTFFLSQNCPSEI